MRGKQKKNSMKKSKVRTIRGVKVVGQYEKKLEDIPGTGEYMAKMFMDLLEKDPQSEQLKKKITIQTLNS